MTSEITLLIDGNNTLHRTHWIANNTGTPLINSKGVNVGGLFTFLKTLKSYVDQFNAKSVYIAWDRKLTKNASNFRYDLTNGTYKGTRDTDKNKEVYEIIDDVLATTNLLGVKSIFPGQLEADDVISWLSKTINGKKIIISVDRDFIQLVSDGVSYYNPVKKQLVDTNNFEEIFEMSPREFLYFKAITGDTSDNVPGIEGFGKVKGVKLAKDAHLHFNGQAVPDKSFKIIQEHSDTITKNLKIMDLSYSLEQFPSETDLYREQLDYLGKTEPNFNKFKEVCEEFEFNSIINKINDWQTSFSKKHNDNILAEYFKAFE